MTEKTKSKPTHTVVYKLGGQVVTEEEFMKDCVGFVDTKKKNKQEDH